MRPARHLRATWLGRFLRGRLPDRNPLRRRSDRLETAILAVLLAVLCVTAPIAAVAASAWESGISLRELHVQQVTSHKVKATLLDDAQNTGAYPVTLAEAAIRWTTPDGQIVTGMMRVPADAKAGSVTWIWINASGQLVTPLLRTDIPGRDDLAATAAVAALSAVALLAGLAIHRTMHRHRLTAWGVDWMVTEPRWNSRR